MNNAQQVATYLRDIKNLRLNTIYKYCNQHGLNASEIEFVKWYINQR